MPPIHGRTGVRPAYRPQTFVTDAEGYWRPSKLLVGLHEPQGRQYIEALRELRSQLILGRWFKEVGRTALAVTGSRSGDWPQHHRAANLADVWRSSVSARC